MKKGLLTIFIFLNGLISFSKPNDSLIVSSKEYQTINESIVQLNNETKRVDGRINDWYTNLAIGGSIFIILLGALIGFQWSNARGVARKQAEKELESIRDGIKEAENDLAELQSGIETIESAITTLKEKLI